MVTQRQPCLSQERTPEEEAWLRVKHLGLIGVHGNQTHSCSRAADRDYQEAGEWDDSEHSPFQGWDTRGRIQESICSWKQTFMEHLLNSRYYPTSF